MVLVGHVRDTIFIPYSAIVHPSLLIQFFYFITNFADEAVICFFVVSGLLVGGKCVTGYARHDFSAAEYCIDRLSRLYTVLAPALVLSFGLILLQCRTNVVSDCADLGSAQFFASALFLQNIVTDPPANNHALWSLANEFWYYVVALLICVAAIANHRRRLISIVVLVCVALFLARYDRWDNHSVLLYFPIWAVGIFAWIKVPFRLPVAVSLPAFLVSLLLSRSHVLDHDFYFVRDALIATSLLAVLVSSRQAVTTGQPSKWLLPNISGALARISFSVYLAHSPVLILASAIILRDGRSLDPHQTQSFAGLAVVLAACLTVSILMYYAFERNTPVVRNRLRVVFASIQSAGLDARKAK
jgi:peptidoglycan/LPS O-acetylase OafA/YrhL